MATLGGFETSPRPIGSGYVFRFYADVVGAMLRGSFRSPMLELTVFF